MFEPQKRMEQTIFTQVDHYIESLTCKESAEISAIRKSAFRAGIPDISISPNQGQFLQILARSVQSKRILEVGTLVGYSTMWLAQSLHDDGKVVSIESDPTHAELAREHFSQSDVGKKIELIQGRALEILQGMVDDRVTPFDFVFIDADKPPYLEYFNLALQLTREGSMIVCDNVIRNGEILNENSTDEKVIGVKRLNAWLKGCDKVNATILQNVGVKEYDGMVIAIVL